MNNPELDPLCSGSIKSRIEGCDLYDTKQKRDQCTMSLMGCTDRPAQKPREYSDCELCGINNNCNHYTTMELRNECLEKNCDSTGKCAGTFQNHPPLKEAYSNPFYS